ncbi:MAG: RloB domain-containing protein [Prevotella sp.]|nr:RloB domain-containing protein [Prevotella sp.]
MDRKLTYNKQPGEKALEVEHTYPTVLPLPQIATFTHDSYIQIPSSYKKEDGVLSYNLICVISGGTDRERTFLNELERKHTFKGVNLIFVSTKEGAGGLTPKMMQSTYEEICKDGFIKMSDRTIMLESVDTVYMFTDVDHYKSELEEILVSRNSTSPIWIISNPDFEIWLYYCYRNNPLEDLKAVINEKESQRCSKLKTVNGTFNNGGGLDTRKAFERLEEGIVHSKEHYNETNGIPNLLSTQMHIFAEDVLIRLGNEYREFVQKKQEFRNSMRTKKGK